MAVDSLRNPIDEEQLNNDHITKMGQTIPRFADILVGYATDPGTLYSHNSQSYVLCTFNSLKQDAFRYPPFARE